MDLPAAEMDALLMTIDGIPWIYLSSPPEVQDRGLFVDGAQLIGMPPARLKRTGPAEGGLDVDMPRDKRWRAELLPRHVIVWAPDPGNAEGSKALREPIEATSGEWREAVTRSGHTVVMIGRPPAPEGISGGDFLPWLGEAIEQGAVIANLPVGLFVP
jgi:hypothetical protein